MFSGRVGIDHNPWISVRVSNGCSLGNKDLNHIRTGIFSVTHQEYKGKDRCIGILWYDK